MIWRIGSLFAEGPTISAYPGYGILAENAPSDGENGPALGYRPEWFGKEVRCEVVVQPTNGTLEIFEDTSFIYTGNGQPDTAQVQFYLDGIAEPAPETLQLNPASVEQVVVSGGVASKTVSAVAATSFVNKQEFLSGCTVAIQREVIADTTFINELGSEQIVVSGAVVSRTTAAEISTQFIEEQQLISGGVSAITKAVVFSTEFVEDFTQVQEVTSGGVCAVHRDFVADTAMINEQSHISGSSANRTMRVIAVTSFFDDGYVPPFSRVGLSASVRRPGYSATLIQ